MQAIPIISSENVWRKSEKNQVKNKILGLWSTQWTKGYLVEAGNWRCSGKKVLWNFWQNSEENACIVDFLKKIVGSKPATLFKERFLHTFFPMSFLELFGTVFYRTPVNDYLF